MLDQKFSLEVSDVKNRLVESVEKEPREENLQRESNEGPDQEEKQSLLLQSDAVEFKN